MSILMRNTVDRLDRPSAYYISKVRRPSLPNCRQTTVDSESIQNKRRKFQDEPEPQEEAPDPLANATTLYVGNLYGYNSGCMAMVL